MSFVVNARVRCVRDDFVPDTLSRAEIVARRNLLLGNGYQGTSVY